MLEVVTSLVEWPCILSFAAKGSEVDCQIRPWDGRQYDSKDIGDYCPMCYGSRFRANPSEPCAYLNDIAGWTKPPHQGREGSAGSV